MEKLNKNLFQDHQLKAGKKIFAGWCVSGYGVTYCANGMTDVGN